MDPVTLGMAKADARKKYAPRRDVYRALISAVPPKVVHPSAPTIAHSTTAPTGLKRINRKAYGRQFSLISCVPFDTNGRLTNNSDAQGNNIAAWGWEAEVSGGSLVFGWRASPLAEVRMQVFIDGLPTTLDLFTPSGITLAIGGIYYTTITFADTATHRVEVRWRSAALYDLYVPVVGELAATRPSKPKVACLGGSFSGSTSYYNELEAWPWALGDALGWEVYQCAIGGSGYVAGTPYNSTARLDAIVAANPDLIIVEGSGNDDGQSYAAITAKASELYAALDTRLPGVPVAVIGAMPRSSAPTLSTDRATNLRAVRDAAIAAPNVAGLFFDPCGTVDPLPVHATATAYTVGARVSYNGAVYQCFAAHTSNTAAPSPDSFSQISWTSGTGSTAAPNGSGSRDYALAADGTHPTPLGQKIFAANLIREMKSRLLA